jgi:uncharacterized repeat protein (TIGR01451 family)
MSIEARLASGRFRSHLLAAVLSIALAGALGLPGAAGAVGTPAGTDITNQATATYTVGGTPLSQTSLPATVTVLELIDVVVTSQDAGPVSVATPDAGRVLTFLVTNVGNGSEDFAIQITNVATPPDDFDPTSISIYLDTDGTPGLDTATDTLHSGPADVSLDSNGGAAADRMTVFVVGDIPGSLSNGDVADVILTAISANHPGGSPTPGTVLGSAGDGGIDAVLGTGSGDDADTGSFVVADVTVSIVKSLLQVSDPFGGSQPVPNATLRYRIVVTVTGSATAAGVTIADPVPPNTSYATASMTLDDGGGGGAVALSDVADADAGQFVAGPPAEVRVALGDLLPGSPAQTIEFSVTSN